MTDADIAEAHTARTGLACRVVVVAHRAYIVVTYESADRVYEPTDLRDLDNPRPVVIDAEARPIFELAGVRA